MSIFGRRKQKRPTPAPSSTLASGGYVSAYSTDAFSSGGDYTSMDYGSSSSDSSSSSVDSGGGGCD